MAKSRRPLNTAETGWGRREFSPNRKQMLNTSQIAGLGTPAAASQSRSNLFLNNLPTQLFTAVPNTVFWVAPQ